MKNNLMLFYGSKIDKVEYEKLLKNYGETNLYTKIYSQGLQIRDVGKIGESWTYIIGKEIYWSMNNIINLNIKNNNILIDKEKIEFKVNENEIRKKLLDINIQVMPEYKIFCSWEN